MAETWPAGVPQLALVEGYNEEDVDNTAEFKPEVGAPLVHRRAVQDIEMVTCVIIMTLTQYDTLKEFRRSTLKSGALLAIGLHPRKGTACTLRLLKLSAPQIINGTDCKVSMDMMIYLN